MVLKCTADFYPKVSRFVNKKGHCEPKHGLFFIDVFGDSSFQRVGDIEKVETEILLGYKMMDPLSFSVNYSIRIRGSLVLMYRHMMTKSPARTSLNLWKVKLEARVRRYSVNEVPKPKKKVMGLVSYGNKLTENPYDLLNHKEPEDLDNCLWD
ncbi:hypothetical protein Tco_1334235 [Tanacetum coccineum]